MSQGSASSGPHGDGPKLYRCDLGGEWKPLDCFSTAQQRKAGYRLRHVANSGMICRGHNGEPTLEIRCQGPCGLVLPLSAFSKATRQKNINICKACQGWAANLEFEITPTPAPRHEMGPDEHLAAVGMPVIPEAALPLRVQEGDYMPLAPVTGTLRHGTATSSGPSRGRGTTSSTSIHVSGTEEGSRNIPPHLLDDFSSLSVSPHCPSVQRGRGKSGPASARNPRTSDKSWPRNSEMRISREQRLANMDRSFQVERCVGSYNGQFDTLDGAESEPDDDDLIPVSPKKGTDRLIRQHPSLAQSSQLADEMSQVAPNPWYNSGYVTHEPASSPFPATLIPATAPASAPVARPSQPPQNRQALHATQSNQVPPHLRSMMSSAESVTDSPSQDGSISGNSISTATTLRQAQVENTPHQQQAQRNLRKYTGWDPSGNAHHMRKAQTEASFSETSGEVMVWRRVKKEKQPSVHGGFKLEGQGDDQRGQNTLINLVQENDGDDDRRGHADSEFDTGWISDDDQ